MTGAAGGSAGRDGSSSSRLDPRLMQEMTPFAASTQSQPVRPLKSAMKGGGGTATGATGSGQVSVSGSYGSV